MGYFFGAFFRGRKLATRAINRSKVRNGKSGIPDFGSIQNIGSFSPRAFGFLPLTATIRDNKGEKYGMNITYFEAKWTG
jgi:hypothetical protein